MTREDEIRKVLEDALAGLGEELSGARAAIQRALDTGDASAILGAANLDALTVALSGITLPLAATTLDGYALGVDLLEDFAFDAIDERAIRSAIAQSGRLIVDVTDDVRARVRELVADTLRGDHTVDGLARQIKTVVGLNERQAAATRNTYAREVTRQLDKGASLAKAEALADNVSTRQAKRLLTSRSRTIARTEVSRATNAGRFEGWGAAVDAGKYPDDLVKEWITGAEPCPLHCDPLDRQRIPWRDYWPTLGILMPPAHPACRCTCALLPATAPKSGPRAKSIDPGGRAPTTTHAQEEVARTGGRLPTTGGAALLKQSEGDAIASATMRKARGEITNAEYRAIVEPIRTAVRNRA